MNPAPALSTGLTSWERFLALATRVCLYLTVVGFPLSGLLVNAFYAAIFAHVGAAMKHHFIDRRVGEIRRMIA
jgi:cytochrome b561